MPALRQEDIEITTAVSSLINKLLKTFPMGPESPLAELYKNISEVITSGLTSEKPPIKNLLVLLSAMTDADPNYVQDLMQPFVKLLEVSTLCKVLLPFRKLLRIMCPQM